MKKGTTYISVKGVDDVINNLRKTSGATTRQMRLGLYAAGLHLQRLSQEMAPVEQGKLKASAFTRDMSTPSKSLVLVGYANVRYAEYVHEQVAMKWRGKKRKGTRADGLPRKGRYWDPQGKAGAKFLERPFKDEFFTLMDIIKKSVSKAINEG